jgi:phage shock protein C
MYCTKCGAQLEEKDFYCSQCGTATAKARPYVPRAARQLMRSRYNKKIAGVCGGFAEYLEVDPTLVRVIWLALAFLPFPGAILAYIIAWIAMPKEPYQVPAAGQFVPAHPYQG